MARTAVPVITLVLDSSTLQDAGVALDPTNGHSIPVEQTGLYDTMLDIDSTFAGAKTFTIKAGPGASGGWPQGGGLGDLVVSLNAQRALIPLTMYRFAQLDGNFYVDVQAGATGTIRARRIPQS